MKGSEITDLIRIVNATYPNAKPITPLAEPIWIEDLAEFDVADVRTAFAAYRRGGNAFPPGSADLRRLVLELARPGVTFEQVWAQIGRTIADLGRERADEALYALAPVPFALDLVAAMGGWTAICNAGPDEARPTDPGVWRAQAEHAFKALAVQRRDDEAVAGLPGLRAAAASDRLTGGLTAIADIRPTWGAPALQSGTRLALPAPAEIPPPAEPLRALPEPPAQERDRARLIALIPPTGPAYRHGPGCVCENCMPIPAEAPEPAAQASPPKAPRHRRRGATRRRVSP